MRQPIGAVVLAAALASAGAGAAEAVYSTRHGAIHGHDPVAYFAEGRPVKGRPDITFEWSGATWHFMSDANREAFAADPGRYAPQYGGYCAYAVAQGATASVDPGAWRIVDGRLYLNNSAGVHRRWQQDIPGHIARADANWPRLIE